MQGRGRTHTSANWSASLIRVRRIRFTQVFAAMGQVAHMTKQTTNAERARRLEFFTCTRNLHKDDGMTQQVLDAIKAQRKELPNDTEKLADAVAAYHDAVIAEAHADGVPPPPLHSAGPPRAEDLPLHDWLKEMRSAWEA